MSETTTSTIPASHIIAALERAGIEAEPFHSGGGCCTIAFGGSVERLDPWTGELEQRSVGLIGPGSCDPYRPHEGVFYPDEMYVGPDDDGETAATEATTVADVVAAALLVVAHTGS